MIDATIIREPSSKTVVDKPNNFSVGVALLPRLLHASLPTWIVTSLNSPSCICEQRFDFIFHPFNWDMIRLLLYDIHTCVSKNVTLLTFPVCFEPSFLSLLRLLRFNSFTNLPAAVFVFFGTSFDSVIRFVCFVCLRGEHLT